MASLLAFGRYLPAGIRNNLELAGILGCDGQWILQLSGIEERRIAGPNESVADMAVAAAKNCLGQAGTEPGRIGLVIVASGTAERRFPGPAAEVAERLAEAGIPAGIPAIDLPIASAGSLFGLALAAQLSPAYGSVLVVAAEKMAEPAMGEPLEKNVAILFGDGAGACLIGAPQGENRDGLEIIDSVLHSDGAYADDLRLEFSGGIQMNGYSVILQAIRKIPAAINELLSRNKIAADSIRTFVMHQANQNLIDRVARAIGVPGGRFYSNIARYGNTSSASMLIAAGEWLESISADAGLVSGDLVCFAAFGAGFHWGALLARKA